MLTAPSLRDVSMCRDRAAARVCRFSDKYPFRMRSETADIAIELSMQPWHAFRPDGVIMFSDILTPLPAIGIEFDVVRGKGPIIQEPIRRYHPHTSGIDASHWGLPLLRSWVCISPCSWVTMHASSIGIFVRAVSRVSAVGAVLELTLQRRDICALYIQGRAAA